MKRLFSILLILTLVFLVAGCSQQPKEEAVLPPTRTGAGTAHMSLPQYSFETACSTAEVIARVKVGDWIAEDTISGITYFKATTLQCFKGTIPESFTLCQDGCSTYTLAGYPLFTAGNELLLFLREPYPADKELEEDQPRFWIIGSYTTVFDVAYDSEGSRYYLDRTGTLGSGAEGCTSYSSDKTIREELEEYIYKTDPFLETVRYRIAYAFADKELEAAIEKQVVD